jgi:hypothetical protein
MLLAILDDAIAFRTPDTYGCDACKKAVAGICEGHSADAAEVAGRRDIRLAVEAAKDDEGIAAALGLRIGGTE